MSPTIAEFLTHGTLPFTGRAADVDRIVRFWRETFQAARVRSLLISGEAGIGKSALLEAAVHKIEAEGGTVIQLRLYPEATTSIAPLLARALWLAPNSRSLLRSEPEGSLHSVIAALRRIVRLRPTVLVIDNLRQLSPGTLNDLHTLTAAMADEPLALVGTTSVGETAVRAAFEHTVAEQIELKGLAPSEVAALCAALLEGPVSPEILTMVLAATIGNPLAIRSAIRGAITGGTIKRNQLSGTWEPRVDDAVLRKQLAADVGALSIGMSLHLTEEERDAARRLAMLGEVFSREAAEVILPDRPEMLGVLQEKGIITVGALGSIPLPGLPGSTEGAFPLAFAHTLMHRSLLNGPELDATPLLDIISRPIPLFSIVPFRIIVESNRITVSPEMIEQYVFRVMDMSYRIDGTTDWALGVDLDRWGLALLDRYGDRLDPADEHRLRVVLVRLKTYTLSRTRTGPEFVATANELLRMTENPTTEQQIRDRVFALAVFMDGTARGQEIIRGIDEEVIAEIDGLVAAHPFLLQTNEYLYYLIDLARIGTVIGIGVTMERARRLYKELIERPDITPEFRQLARSRVGTNVLLVFESQEEIDEHLQLLEELEADSEKIPANRYLRMKGAFMKEIMRYEEAIALIDQMLPEFADMGMKRIYDQWVIGRIEMTAAFGADLAEIERQIAAVADATPESGRYQVYRYAGVALMNVAIRLGNFEAAARGIEKYSPADERDLRHAITTCVGLDDCSQLADPLRPVEEIDTLTPLVDLHLGRDVDMDDVRDGILTVIRHIPLRSEDVVFGLLAISLLEKAAASNPRGAELLAGLRDDVRTCLIRRLERLAENRMFSYVSAIVERWGTYLSTKELKSWRARAAELAAEWKEAHPAEERNRKNVHVTMFGRIEIAKNGEEPKPSRGARLRTLLGLMVANQILDAPLSLQEFCTIAEDETDPERAKNNLHVGIHRLREALGHEAILTESRVPQLNPELVEVDLIDAHRLLTASNEALRQGHLIRAWSALRDALEITCGEVPYPTLYNSFFEAARQDFELFLRATTIAVARAFLLEEDAASAAQVLRLAIASMPGDDEISELLSDALVRSGRHAEAHRMRMRSGSEEMSDS